MPSFDVVSEVDKHHLTNAVDQANRQVTNRYDFKGVDARFERNEYTVTLVAEAEFQITQMLDILQSALLKNTIDIACLDYQPIKASGKEVKQEILVRTGIETELAKKLEEVCPVDIFRATEAGTEIVRGNLDECVLCGLCVDAAPSGTVTVKKLYDGTVLSR